MLRWVIILVVICLILLISVYPFCDRMTNWIFHLAYSEVKRDRLCCEYPGWKWIENYNGTGISMWDTHYVSTDASKSERVIVYIPGMWLNPCCTKLIQILYKQGYRLVVLYSRLFFHASCESRGDDLRY